MQNCCNGNTIFFVTRPNSNTNLYRGLFGRSAFHMRCFKKHHRLLCALCKKPVESTNNMKQKNKEVKTVEPKKIIFIWQNEGKLLRLLSDQRLNHRKTSCKQELWGKMETSCPGHTVNDMVKTGRFLFHGSSKVWISSPNWLSLIWSYLLISGVL